jgi:hypothetical protein
MNLKSGDKIVYNRVIGTVMSVNTEKNTFIFRSEGHGEKRTVALDAQRITLLNTYSNNDLNAQNAFLKTLIGKTFHDFTLTNETFGLWLNGVEYFELRHDQDCCEDVYIESIEGNIQDLLDSPLTMAEAISNDEADTNSSKTRRTQDVEEWTFYKFATVKGYVTIRFYGTSNGYYSTGVGLESNIINAQE